MAYRATIQESTGFSPNFLMFGRELSMPVDIMFPVNEAERNETPCEYAKELRRKLEYAYELTRRTLKRSTNGKGDYTMSGFLVNR